VTAITSLLLTWGTCQTAIPANITWASFEKTLQRITEQTSQATRSNKSGFPMMDGVRGGVRVVVGDTEQTRQFLHTENVRRRISFPGRFVSICCRSQELTQYEGCL
jgi:ribosomal protein S6E (S10)